MHVQDQNSLTLLRHVLTDEDRSDNIVIVSNEEIPKYIISSGEDQHTNLENELDSDGNSTTRLFHNLSMTNFNLIVSIM